MSGRAVDAALLHPPGDPAAPVLAGSRCAVDGTVVFPAQASCPRCSGRDVARVALPERGVLWSWTVQHFRPRAPFRSFQPDGEEEEEFEPFAVGYVDLGPVVVESRLALPTPAPVREHGVAPVSLGETGATPCSKNWGALGGLPGWALTRVVRRLGSDTGTRRTSAEPVAR